MKKLVFLMLIILYSCNDQNSVTTFVPNQNEFNWIVPDGAISGSLNPFPLANNPIMSRVKDIDFISDKSIVAVVSMGNEIRVYPYQYISRFEAINDNINNIDYTMTYCPITQSGLVIDTKFKDENFILRASGYLFNDNVVLLDEKSDTYWSQIGVKSIKGKYANENISTHNFVEFPWEIVKEFFPEAIVFTNTSVQNKSGTIKKEDIQKGDLVYGVIDFNIIQKNKVYIYELQNFSTGTVLKTNNISSENLLVIGNQEFQFITSYINNTSANFNAVQDQFPIVMEDDQNNKWNVFGTAVSGPRKGEQLKSKTSFKALWWAWQIFYEDFIFES